MREALIGLGAGAGGLVLGVVLVCTIAPFCQLCLRLHVRTQKKLASPALDRFLTEKRRMRRECARDPDLADLAEDVFSAFGKGDAMLVARCVRSVRDRGAEATASWLERESMRAREAHRARMREVRRSV